MEITYRLSVELKTALAKHDGDPDYQTAESAVLPSVKRDIEKAVLRLLGKGGYDVDVEVMETEIDDSEPAECRCDDCQIERGLDNANDRDRYDDDGREYADPRDYRDGLE